VKLKVGINIIYLVKLSLKKLEIKSLILPATLFFVYSLENKLLHSFLSSREAAKHFNRTRSTVLKYANLQIIKKKNLLYH